MSFSISLSFGAPSFPRKLCLEWEGSLSFVLKEPEAVVPFSPALGVWLGGTDSPSLAVFPL